MMWTALLITSAGRLGRAYFIPLLRARSADVRNGTFELNYSAPANALVQSAEPALGEERRPLCDLADRSLVLVIESVEAIWIIDQLQHSRPDTFPGTATGITGLLQKRDLLRKSLQNNPHLQGIEFGHIAFSELGLLGVEEELVQTLSYYQCGPALYLVAVAIELGLDQGGEVMAKVDQTGKGDAG